jgi:hypothetical protein
MRHIIILFFFSSISLFGQETESNHHLFFKPDIGAGYSSWHARTPYFNSNGSGLNLNLNLTPYYNYKNLMIGIGYGYEMLMIDTLISTTDNFPYGPGFKNNFVSFNKVSLSLIYNFIHIRKISAGAAVRIGTYRLDKSFANNSIEKKWLVETGLDFNYMLGDRVDLFLQPNFEYKYYQMKKDLIGGQNVNHRIRSFNCSLGLNFKIL